MSDIPGLRSLSGPDRENVATTRLQGFSAEGRRDLLEIVEARHGHKSILIASQIPVDDWPRVFGEPTIADAVLDRIVHNAYRIELKGESQRNRNKPPPLDGGNDK